jgi:hypothetical protein
VATVLRLDAVGGITEQVDKGKILHVVEELSEVERTLRTHLLQEYNILQQFARTNLGTLHDRGSIWRIAGLST